ncbi:HAD family hydrolase [Streptomyces sp. NPDC020422]|uniref:HAD family hydrolase n=1 Tax=Streptomyces sp. NPDC020422 TaxID=3365074 RepID=UPI0037AFDFDB
MGVRQGDPPPRGVVLDTDGVLLDSATVHAAAWKAAFDACLAGLSPATAPQPPFDADAEYRRYVDGRSRYDGAEAFLASRGLRLPPGTPGDPPGHDTVWAVAAHKERLFVGMTEAGGVPVYHDSRPALTALRAAGVPRAAVSASRHARALLAEAGLDRLLDTVVDGTDAARLGLAGKPDPALFRHAATALGTDPGACAVVEDALSGVLAARRGGFRLVAGVDRTPDRHATPALLAQGADLVVPDLLTLVRTVWGDPA